MRAGAHTPQIRGGWRGQARVPPGWARLGASRGRAQRYLVPGPEVARRECSSGDLSVCVDLTSRRFPGVWGCAGWSRLIVRAGGDSAGLGWGRGSGLGWYLCSGSAKRVADGLPFYVRRWMG